MMQKYVTRTVTEREYEYVIRNSRGEEMTRSTPPKRGEVLVSSRIVREESSTYRVPVEEFMRIAELVD